ncbi:MAG: DUF2141 domain-containing protein [Alphaproteobacteria bacterium]|nr:DUF2141 domain-containing protein [Alphaproteobacteria bacterium]
MSNMRPSVLSKLVATGLLAGFCASVPAMAAKGQDATVDHDPQLCEAPASGRSYVRVSVSGFKDEEGNVRVQIYGPSKDDFLEKGKKLVRVDVKTEGDGQQICVPMPNPGRYTLVVMHDRNENGKADFFSEGFGFSNNPKLNLSPPDADEVVFDAPAGVLDMSVDLKYIFGADEEQMKKRRQLRRR